MTSRGGAEAARPAHTRKDVRSNRTPATSPGAAAPEPGEGSPPFPPRACLCGHLEVHHATRRGRCIGDIRVFISRVPDHALRPGDRILEKAEAEKVVNEAAAKVARAPSYRKQFETMLKRWFITLPCQCKLYHELPIPNEETGITLWAPDGSPAA